MFGPNGHGKTTLLRTISGLIRAWSGTIRFDGTEIGRMAPRHIVELGLVQVPQGNRLFPDLTIRETLRLGAWPSRARAEESANADRVVAIFPNFGNAGTSRCARCPAASGRWSRSASR